MPVTVTTIESQREKNIPGKGDFISWKLTVHDGTKETQGVELFQKKESVPPEVGKTYESWSVETSQYGLKIKKEPRAGGGFGGGPRQRDPKETAAIQRQHSQSAAVAYLAAKVQANALEGPFPSLDAFRLLVDWFQNDIAWGVRLSQAPGYGQEPKRKEPVQTGKSDVPDAGQGEFEHPKTDLDKTPFAV